MNRRLRLASELLPKAAAEHAGALLRRPLSGPELAGLVLSLVLAAASYCWAHSLLTEQPTSFAVTLGWASAVILPWIGAFELGKHQIAHRGQLRWPLAVGLLAAALIVSTALQAIVEAAFLSSASPLKSIAFRRLPTAAVLGLLLAISAAFVARAPSREGAAEPEALPSHDAALLLAQAEWIRGAGNYVEIKLADRLRVERVSMSRCEGLLEGKGFVRIHRSAIVNLHSVAAILKDEKGERLRTRDGSEHRIGSTYRHRLARAIASLQP